MLFSVLRPSKTFSLHKVMGILRSTVKDGFVELLSCCVYVDALHTTGEEIKVHSASL